MAYIQSKVGTLVPSQIRALRLKSDMPRQSDLARAAEMHQSRISMFETPGANPTVSTLSAIAAALKVGLKIEFVRFSEMLDWENSFSQDRFEVTKIDNDFRFLNPAAAPTQLSIPAVTNSSSWSPAMAAFCRPAQTVSPLHVSLSSSIASFSIPEDSDLLKGVTVSQMKPTRVNINPERVPLELLIAHQEQEKYADA